MARVCGQCHREQGHSLELRDVQVETHTPKSDQIGSRMFRHAWAAERMWEGLMAPSEQSWRAGSMALAHAPARAPKVPSPVPEDFALELSALRDLGLRASAAESLDERTDVYGLTIATCAHCHVNAAAHELSVRP
jgi:cytochrome c553